MRSHLIMYFQFRTCNNCFFRCLSVIGHLGRWMTDSNSNMALVPQAKLSNTGPKLGTQKADGQFGLSCFHVRGSSFSTYLLPDIWWEISISDVIYLSRTRVLWCRKLSYLHTSAITWISRTSSIKPIPAAILAAIASDVALVPLHNSLYALT
jgi:hypothetical protein